ncbi:MAG TPA: UvrD-helicase domain-containing protein, partial [Kiloniellaceae bacterium]|nr:UvrD-helicase domain-containing protein [Kiloniellaceae bacterium]
LDGPLLLLAGAGTGKTRALTTRLAHLLSTGRARSPGEILAVTFTNKAAREMKDRVAALLGLPSVEGWWLGTFHSIAARILRDHAERVGLTRSFTILDTDDQLRLVKQILQAENIDDKKSPARSVLAVMQRWKDRGLLPEKVSAGEAGDFANGRIVALYQAYQDRLRSLNACDFGDLLLHNLTIFQSHPDVLADYHRRFRYILVDEYQDTNVAQYLWLRLLAQGHRNLCCVGDDDQSIYGWRGAEVGNILRFEKDFPGALVVRLERNYRSTGRILAAASALIAHNEDRLGKTLWTEDEEGEKVRLRGLWDGEAEARFVGEEIEALQRATPDMSLSSVAVLVRTGAQTREFEERFLTLGLPYRVVGGPRFYERMEIRDALAYLRVVYSPRDDLAFERIVNKPKRGLGDATLRQLHGVARAAEISLFQAAQRLVETDELRPAARRSLARLLDDFSRWQALLDSSDHVELAQTVLEESGYTEMWMNDKSLEAPGRLENLKELVVALAEFENLGGFLEHVALVMESLEAEGGDQVNIMTLHAAKGLEFDTVFLPGWEEGLFPNQRALDETGQAGLEEERRLAYVGLTRARKRAIVSYVANRRLHGSWTSTYPSRFVEELPTEHLEAESEQGLQGGAGAFGAQQSVFGDWSMKRTSPGLARARERGRAAPFIDVTPQSVESLPSARFSKGARVFHQKFGYGSIVQVEGDRLTIDFDKAGQKKVVASFVVPADQAG